METERYNWVEANIAFYKSVPHIFKKEEKHSLHVFEETLKWGDISFTKITAIGYDKESCYSLTRNGKTQHLTTEQGRSIFQ